MDRDTARTVALAALAVLALSAAAATIDSAVDASGRSPGLGTTGERGVGSGTAGGVGFDRPSAAGRLLMPVCLPWLNEPPALLVILGGFLALGAVAYRQTGSVLPPVALGIAFGIPVLLVHALLTACRPATAGGGFGGSVPNATAILPAGGGGALVEGGGAPVSAPSAFLGVLLVLALGGAVLALVASTADDESPAASPEEEPPETDVDVAAVGRAAGDAADRIERAADVDNEVYRAWAEMTAHLDVPNPAASTPAEFAAAAVDAGMARDDVAELTRLFETVRYGGAAPTEERERRAVGALRRIESTYAAEDEP